MPKQRKIIVGSPGTGKTEKCLSKVEAALDRGVPPDQVAFLTFTKAAAEEARQRAAARFKLPLKSLPYFRTLHSLCFRELGLSPSDIITKTHLNEIADVTGENLTTLGASLEDSSINRIGDLMLTLDNYARTTGRTIEDAHRHADQELDWFRLKRFHDAYKLYREDRGMMDFTDMLQRYAEFGGPLRVQVAVLDEAQDLTPLQWRVAERALSAADEVWIAGDDDQEIYHWSGADAEHFLNLGYEREVLTVSHRLSEAVFNFGQGIIQRVSRRFPKNVRPARAGGLVTWAQGLDDVDVSKGTWLLLARTRQQLEVLESSLREQGVVYQIRGRPSVDKQHLRAISAYEALRKGAPVDGADAALVIRALGYKAGELDETGHYTAQELALNVETIWHDALIKIPLDDREYYLACRRRGENLSDDARIRINTIHGSKGQEAEHVVLVTDLTYRVQRGYERDPDSEHRVFYVGASRALNSLTLLAPSTCYGYEF
jgi:superfamily I DNA/RNA helicase